MPGTVRVTMFAAAREAAGRSTVDLEIPARGVPARTLVRALVDRYPRLAPVLRAARFVRNGRYLRGLQGVVRPGDEFAVHPPYGGG